jgi:hypothetical protein
MLVQRGRIKRDTPELTLARGSRRGRGWSRSPSNLSFYIRNFRDAVRLLEASLKLKSSRTCVRTNIFFQRFISGNCDKSFHSYRFAKKVFLGFLYAEKLKILHGLLLP